MRISQASLLAIVLASLCWEFSASAAFGQENAAADPQDAEEAILIRNRSFAIETNSISDFTGAIGLQLMFGVSDQLAIGPVGSLLNVSSLNNDHYSGYTAGLGAAWYPTGTRFNSGMVFNFVAGKISYSATVTATSKGGAESTGDFEGYFGGATAGYQWFLDSGFSFSLGAGFVFNTISRSQSLVAANGTRTAFQPAYAGLGFAPLANVGIAF